MHVEDLLIRIRPSDVPDGDQPRFRVDAVASSGEAACGTLHLPTRERLHQLVTALAGAGERDFRIAGAGPDGEGLLREVGEELSGALFQGELLETWGALVGREARPRRPLRLRFSLRLDDEGAGVLGEVPWEALMAPRNGQFLGLEPGFSLVRYIEQRGGDEAPPPPKRLKVLAVAGVDLPGRPPLDFAGELERLEAALNGPDVELSILSGASWETLRSALDARRPHVLHFLGHGGFDPRAGGGVLYMADGGGGAAAVPSDLLSQGLKRAVWSRDDRAGRYGPGLRLVVLNACRTAQVAAEAPFSGMATALVRNASVPAVVAMQYPVRDDSAIAFSDELYRQLAAGVSLEEAVQDGRDRMRAIDLCDWVAPALFSRLEGGLLFRRPTAESRGPRVRGDREEPRPSPAGGERGGGAAGSRARRAVLGLLAAGLLLAVGSMLVPGAGKPEPAGLSTFESIEPGSGSLQSIEEPEVTEDAGAKSALSKPEDPPDRSAAPPVAVPDDGEAQGPERTGDETGFKPPEAPAGGATLEQGASPPRPRQLTLGVGSPLYFEDLGLELSVEFQSELSPNMVTLHLGGRDTTVPRAVFAHGLARFELPEGIFTVRVLDVDPAAREVRVMPPQAVI